MFFVLFPLVLFIILALIFILIKVKIDIFYDGSARAEITASVFKIELSGFSKAKGKSSLPPTVIYNELTELISKSSVCIRELKASSPFSAHSPEDIIFLGGYNSLASLIIAYLSSNAEKLTIEDGALVFSNSLTPEVSARITVRVRMFYILRAMLHIVRAKFSAKKGLKNGRN